MRVKPTEGREAMRDPRTMLRIPAEGVEVAGHEPWVVRGIAHGDLQDMDAKANAAAEAADQARVEAEAAKAIHEEHAS